LTGCTEQRTIILDNPANIKGNGTTGYIPIWSDARQLEDSSIYQSGLGTFINSDLYIGGNIVEVISQNVTGDIIPSLTNNFYLGSSSLKWKGLYTTDIYSSGNGKVGIGTTAPQRGLDIAGSSLASATASGIQLTDTAGNINSRRWLIANSYGSLFGDLSFAVSTANNTNPISPTDVKMTIARSGNVGIGTTSPTTKLDVNGNVRITGYVGIGTAPSPNRLTIAGNTYISSGNLYVNDGQGMLSADGINGVRVNRASSSSQNAIYFNTNSLTRMTIKNGTGYIGIGTTAPSYNLDIVGQTYASQGFITANNQGYGIKRNSGTIQDVMILDTGDDIQIGSSVLSNDIKLRSSSGNLVTVLTTGNVGIGTTTPVRNVHIKDTMRLEPRSSAPTSASLGDLYVDSDSFELCMYNSTAWVGLSNGGTCS